MRPTLVVNNVQPEPAPRRGKQPCNKFYISVSIFAFLVSQDVAITIQEWCTSSVDVGGGENSDVPIWAVFFVIIPCHLFMCWSGEECEKKFGWKLGYALEREGRKPVEFVFWATNGALAFLLLLVFSNFLTFMRRKRRLNIFCANVLAVFVAFQLYVSFAVIK